jgi:hypothetical protein
MHQVVVAVVDLAHLGRHMVAVAVVVLAHVDRPAVRDGGDGGCDIVVLGVLAADAPRHPCKPCCYAEKLLLYY